MRKVSKEALEMIPGVLNFADEMKLLSLMSGTAVLYTFTVTRLDTLFLRYGWICFVLGLSVSVLGYVFAYLSQDNVKDSINLLKNKQDLESSRALALAKLYRTLGIASAIISLLSFLVVCLFVSLCLLVSCGCKWNL